MKWPEQFRWKNPPHIGETKEGDPFGAFRIPASGNCRAMDVIATDGDDTGWEHVSVSLLGWPLKCPSWQEMCAVKRLFWDDNEVVVQFHPAESNYVNVHPGVLHLWRCTNKEFPMPPKICV